VTGQEREPAPEPGSLPLYRGEDDDEDEGLYL
jgi:hypothetical protein